jgi:hypothetical protein
MLFLKEHLTGRYEWEPISDQTVFSGSPTRRLFNRVNGNQVLFLINLYSELSGQHGIREGRKMEELLLFHLPLEAKSEISVFNWLRETFDRFPDEKLSATTQTNAL